LSEMLGPVYAKPIFDSLREVGGGKVSQIKGRCG
jgi:hypothetical protein